MKGSGAKLTGMLVFVYVWLGAALTGCGADKPMDIAGIGERGSGSAERTSRPYTFTWVSGQSTPVEADAKMVRYWEQKFNVVLDVWNIDSKRYADMMNMKFAAGEIPDRMNVNGFVRLKQYVDQDILAKIPLDMLRTHAPNVYARTEREHPGAFEYATIDGNVYGIPKLNYFARYRAPVVWRGDWLSSVGIDAVPETLDEFETAVYKFAKEDPDRNGKHDTYGLSGSSLDLVYGAYGYMPFNWSERDGKLVYGAVQPEMKEALGRLQRWYKDGVIDPEFISGENTGGYWAISHAFIRERIGLSSLGHYYHWVPVETAHNYVEMKKKRPQAAESLAYGLPPKGSDGKMGAPQGNELSGNFVSFGKQLEKEPDKLAKLLHMIDSISAADFETYVTAMYGVRGEDWEFNERNVPVSNTGSSLALEKMGANNVMESLELPEFTEKKVLSLPLAEEYRFDVGGIRNWLLAALPGQAKYESELRKLQDRAYVSIITGDRPLDYFDEFVKQWKSGGGAQLEREANEWYARSGHMR
ncbi:MAG: extracellular solute-binding protein [Paenibacillus sp.]|nr:extracellular solute-binding protein [Paenibacillus sp.]